MQFPFVRLERLRRLGGAFEHLTGRIVAPVQGDRALRTIGRKLQESRQSDLAGPMMKNMDLTWYLEIHGEFPLSDGASIGYAARVWPLRKTLVFIPPHVGAHPEQVSVAYLREIEREIRRFNADFTLADWKMYVCMLGQLQKPNPGTHTFSLPSLNEIPNEVRGFVTEQIRKQKGSQAG